MTQWSALLDQHTAAAAPRSFDGVLRRVRRRRRRQVVGAALGVLLVVGGAALAVGRPETSTHPRPAATGSPLPGIGQPPTSIVVNGKRLPLLGLRPVGVALVDDRSSTSVRFKPLKLPDHLDPYCGLAYRSYLLGQDATSVHVGLYTYGHYGLSSLYGCTEPSGDRDSFTGLRDLVIPLGIPLGNRKVMSETEIPVLQTNTLLRAPDLPSTFTRESEVITFAPGHTEPADEYDWRAPGGGYLALLQGVVRQEAYFPDGVGGAHEDTTRSVLVRGRAGTLLTRKRPDILVRCLRWLEGRPVALCSEGGRVLTLEQLQAIANRLATAYSVHDAPLVPTTVDLGGSRFQLGGDFAVEAVYATRRDDEIEVRGGRDTTSAECGPIVRSYVLSEDSAVVRIGSYVYEGVGGSGSSCPVAPEARQTLHLQRPLGSRVVLAVTSDNTEVPVVR